MANNWRDSTWGDEVSLNYGKALRGYDTSHGKFRVYGSNGPIGWTTVPLASGPGVILGRKGAYRGVEYSRDPFFVIDTAYYVVPKTQLDMRWLYYAIKHHKLGEIDDGSPIPSTTRAAVYVRELEVPSINEQRAIAHILGALDDKIELNRRMNETLEGMAQAIFKSWFVDFDPVRAKADGRQPAGMDPATAALFPDSFEDSALGKIPKGWATVSLDQMMDMEGGTQPPASTFIDLPRAGYVRLVQIRDYETDAHRTYIYESTKWRKCAPEDIMIARYGASVARICWGLEGAYNVALVKVVPVAAEYREFLRSFLLSDYFQVRLIGMSNRSAQAGFNKGDIASFDVVRPPKSILLRYHELAWPVRAGCLARKEQSSALAALRDALLPKLLSGEIRVPEAQKLAEVHL